jgi:hypothetical protein
MITLHDYQIKLAVEKMTGSKVVSMQLRQCAFLEDQPRVYKMPDGCNRPEEKEVLIWYKGGEYVSLFLVKTENGLISLFDPATHGWQIADGDFEIGQETNSFTDLQGNLYYWLEVVQEVYSAIPAIHLNMNYMAHFGTCYFNVRCNAIPLEMNFMGSSKEYVKEEVIGFFVRSTDGVPKLFACYFLYDRDVQMLSDFKKFESVRISANDIYEQMPDGYKKPESFEPDIAAYADIRQKNKTDMIVYRNGEYETIEVPKWMMVSGDIKVVMKVLGFYGENFDVYPSVIKLSSKEYLFVAWQAIRREDKKSFGYMVINGKPPVLSDTPGCIVEHATLMTDGELSTNFVGIRYRNGQIEFK